MPLLISRTVPLRRALVVAIGVLAWSAFAEAADWQPYRNDRYGFSVDIPSGFKAENPPDNGDGQAFTSSNGRSTLSVYGHLFVDVAGLVEDEREQETMSEEGGMRITYRQVSSRATTFSGLKGETIVYRHAINTCKNTASAIIDAEYPASEKARFDTIITHMAASLRGSNHCWSPG